MDEIRSSSTDQGCGGARKPNFTGGKPETLSLSPLYEIPVTLGKGVCGEKSKYKESVKRPFEGESMAASQVWVSRMMFQELVP